MRADADEDGAPGPPMILISNTTTSKRKATTLVAMMPRTATQRNAWSEPSIAEVAKSVARAIKRT